MFWAMGMNVLQTANLCEIMDKFPLISFCFIYSVNTLVAFRIIYAFES